LDRNQAARRYQESLLAAEAARVELVELAVRRAADRRRRSRRSIIWQFVRIPHFTFRESAAVDHPGL